MSSLVFGPVPSRRLGRSLGVDLVPFKTCTYDCIYCQLGRTTCKTTERKDWVPIDEVLAALEDRLADRPNYITLSGSGEPTLHARIGELVDRIKSITNIPLAVLTNGSLLCDKEVRRQLHNVDLIVPSLDAATEATFRQVNRPHESITLEMLMDGLVAFRKAFRGDYWLEILLLEGITATDEEVARLVECVDRIRPHRVQLNTSTRPTAESSAVAVGRERMTELAERFHPAAEVIAEFRHIVEGTGCAASQEKIFDMLCRRPCTVDDIASGLALHPNEVVKYVEELTAEKRIYSERVGARVYYRVTD